LAIRDFRDKEAQRIFEGRFSLKLPQSIQKKTRMKLLQLNAAVSLNDLKVPPSNRLEALLGDRAGRFSIRINSQFRVCFEWREGNAFGVEVVDYH
jgi:proteic killer suppression protein